MSWPADVSQWWSECVRVGAERQIAAEVVAYQQLAEAKADAESWANQCDDRVKDCVALIERAEKAEAERDALKADAKRWRYLHERFDDCSAFLQFGIANAEIGEGWRAVDQNSDAGEKLNAVIDAAMQEGK